MTGGFLNIQEVYKNTLRCFRSQIKICGRIGGGAQFGAEHKVELTYLCPVFGTGVRISNLKLFNQRFHIRQIFSFQRFRHSGKNSLLLFSVFYYSSISSFKFIFVECLAEPLCGFVDLFLSLFFQFCAVIFQQNIGSETFLRIFIVNQRIIESIHVAGGFPNCGMHEDRGVDTHDIFIHLNHGFPPVLLDVVF